MKLRLVLALAATAVAALALACGGDNDTASPTPAAPTATVAPTRPPGAEFGGDDGFRAFAAKLDEAVKSGDVAFIAARYQLTTKTCAEEDLGRGDPYCTAAGHTYEGLPFGRWRSEGAHEPTAVVTALIQERIDNQLRTEQDAFDRGWAQVAAINVQQDRYAAVITMLIPRPDNYAGTGPLRVAIGTSWQFDGERWRMTGGLNAGVLAEDLLTPGLAESPYPGLELFGTRDDPAPR